MGQCNLLFARSLFHIPCRLAFWGTILAREFIGLVQVGFNLAQPADTELALLASYRRTYVDYLDSANIPRPWYSFSSFTSFISPASFFSRLLGMVQYRPVTALGLVRGFFFFRFAFGEQGAGFHFNFLSGLILSGLVRSAAYYYLKLCARASSPSDKGQWEAGARDRPVG